ncbi:MULTISPECIES: ATP-dependent helicase [unclassified Sphingobium]|uniref:ATP-dependent helicase n=1 Tax=unclassified Sphingobium TaxID=2611147 RepID=UPI0004538891|nr:MULTISPECIES: ATP-dependent helicase [unclassified Sphingobium]EXS69447.1 helicase [Sphingobium sp. Ant17]KFL47457.1 putative ATP-dependent DNA helicase [Sphingobium sp. ba1]PBN41331.1 ATP-dependent helicase [Sphingobium sp. D43FB]
MSNHLALARALVDLAANAEQAAAVQERGHCVVLAGPGSGKTKTLTTAMARCLVEDVVDPRGVACITYNNECAIELETRLAALGIASNDRAFIGTVHSFALTQVIVPYARCLPGLLPDEFRVASRAECRAAVEIAYSQVFDDQFDPHDRWGFAEEKRRRDVDRSRPDWRGCNPELADFIEAYEAELRRRSLIDFDDMPLIAFRMIQQHGWIRAALRARFPVLFVDEYQDLGYALHELVLLLCFAGGMRLFAVGDADQSIYGFTGADPELLQSLVARADVRVLRLRFNYRSGAKIIRASMGALGEERDYRGRDGAPDGDLFFWKVIGDIDTQARTIGNKILPVLLERHPAEEVAILYRAAWLGDKIAAALDAKDIPYVRTDGNALIKRSSRLARFIEGCARWTTGGWREANPPFARLLSQAKALVFGGRSSDAEEQMLSSQLIAFLRSGIDSGETTHFWLQRFWRELVTPWRAIARNPQGEWDVCSEIATRTDPARGGDIALNIFAGRIEGTGRVSLSTLHSAKGREFDAVILFGMNAGALPSQRDRKTPTALREARRLFYVGVTRPRKELAIVYQDGNPSPWVVELYKRSQQG